MQNEETIVIDPVGMNIVNRIAPGTRFSGVLECSGGVLIQGAFTGNLTVLGGPLVLMEGGTIAGEFTCDGDAYLFGTITERAEGEFSELLAGGAVFMTETLDAKANVTAGAIKTYAGAQVEGRIRTIRKEKIAQ